MTGESFTHTMMAPVLSQSCSSYRDFPDLYFVTRLATHERELLLPIVSSAL
jgi:hypothetical protein